jgi:pSer/pThr/pTyr-binding forkhead associated (FHA) protein
VTVASAAVEEVLLALKLAFLVLLYLFIWQIVRTASRDIRTPQESVAATPQTQGTRQQATPAPPQGRLVVVHSAALPIAQEFRVNAAPLTFGRSGQNDVPLDGDEFVSARHARFQARRDGAWVEDVGSTNGTFVNGERLTAPRLLQAGDTILVGETELRFQP